MPDNHWQYLNLDFIFVFSIVRAPENVCIGDRGHVVGGNERHKLLVTSSQSALNLIEGSRLAFKSQIDSTCYRNGAVHCGSLKL